MEITMVFSKNFVWEGSMIDFGVGNLQRVHTPALFKSNSSLQKRVEELLARADVEVQGSRPLGNDTSVNRNEPWLSKYIFTGSVIPSPAQLGKAMDDLFVLDDWPHFVDQYGIRFYRMWRYYLLSCAFKWFCPRVECVVDGGAVR